MARSPIFMLSLMLSLFIVAMPQATAQATNPWKDHNYMAPIPGAYYVPHTRKFPHNAQKTTLSEIVSPALGTNGMGYARFGTQSLPLAANFRFYNDKGNLLLPKDYVAGRPIAYLAPNGIITKIWLLSDKENSNFESYRFSAPSKAPWQY